MQSWSRFGSGCDCLLTSLITAPVKRHVSISDVFSGQILGSASLSGGSTAVGPGFPDFSGATQGGVLNLINTDGVSSYIPYNPAMSGSFTGDDELGQHDRDERVELHRDHGRIGDHGARYRRSIRP